MKKHRKEEGKHLAWDIRKCQNRPVVHFWELKKMSERCKEETVASKNDWMRKRKLVLDWGGSEMRWDLLRRGCLGQLKHQMWLQHRHACSALGRNRQGLCLAQSSGSIVFLFRVSDVFFHKAGLPLEPSDFRSQTQKSRCIPFPSEKFLLISGVIFQTVV